MIKTEVLTIDPEQVSEQELKLAGDYIRQGKLVAFPTETVYGLGANALDGSACDRIFDAKGRPHDNPLIVHVLDPKDCDRYADTEYSPLFPVLAERFMPGPLTVILPKKEIIPDAVTVGLKTVALRCPCHPVARALISSAGVPIAAPSANRSGKPSPTTAKHVIDDMLGRIDMIIDGGDADVGLESTVISLEKDKIKLLRPGFVTLDDLLNITPNVEVSPSVLEALSTDEKPESPGMKYKHYAPNAPVTMVSGADNDVIAYFIQKEKEGCGILCFEEDLPFFDQELKNVISLGARDDVKSQANRLFSALRFFDKTNVSHIYARETTCDSIGLAVTNRLLRACGFQKIKL